jgi:hypothetical protein
LAIHAAKGFPGWARHLVHEHEDFAAALSPRGYTWAGQLPTGVVLATARLVGCFRITASNRYQLPTGECIVLEGPELSFGDYEPGRYGWLLADVLPLTEPVPARGALGLWDWTMPAQVVTARS